MFWVVQNNLYSEMEYDRLIGSLEQMCVPHANVKVVPFSHDLEPPVTPPEGLVMVYGSTALQGIASRNGWRPGSFMNENHDYRQWYRYGKHLLNADSKVCRFADVGAEWDEFFIRPCDDFKQFAGMVMGQMAFKEWQHKVLDLKETYTTLDADTLVCYAPVRDIRAEYRFFVVDGRLVAWSEYRCNARVRYSSVIDGDVVAFARKMVDLWCPARAFVIDIALTDEGFRVIEINCINAAGLYAADAFRIVEAIEKMLW